MSFVAVFMTATAAFVLLAPLAMVAILVAGGVSTRRPQVAVLAPGSSGCACTTAHCSCVTDLPAAA